ncbi:hypothetical protein [Xylocopilactobacillus apis]|uniref:Glucosyl transferase GtrII n=1 Tax=Xylocopilactobacillus apis TaxID=2932183 RepID=A0AAU9CVR8_9LACO|nr:hypothetical protein [Xylocopilactobacillus apis]BDR56481.1 hypothetical protein KIMC2_10430 [Xylocopilactobacillus apis]
MEEKRTKPLVVYGGTLIYFCLNLFLLFNHEPWRDEINAWLFARDSSTWQIFTGSIQQGHPSLWYYFLAIFAKMGLPIITLNVLSLLVMTVTAFLLLKFGPFSQTIKLILLFTPMFLYNYPVISRNYCLIGLLMVLLCVFYQNRHTNPWPYGISLALLIHTHLMMIGVAFILWLIYLIELWKEKDRKKSEFGVLILVSLSTIILFIQVVFLNKVNVIVGTTSGPTAGFVMSDYLTTVWKFFSDTFVTLKVPAIITVIFWLILFIYLGIYYRKQFFILLVSTVFMALVSAFVYSTIIYMQAKVISLFYILLYIMWTILEDHDYQPYEIISKTGLAGDTFSYVFIGAIVVVGAISSFSNAVDAVQDFNEPFSESKEVGEYINKELPSDAVLIDTNAFLATPVVGYMKPTQKMIDIRAMKKLTYTPWDYDYFWNMPFSKFKKNIEKIKNKYSHVYWLYNNTGTQGLEYQPKIDKMIMRYYTNQDIVDYAQKLPSPTVFDNKAINGDESNYMIFKLK